MVVDQTEDLLFHALADATRRDIVRRTMDGSFSVSTLARDYPMSFAAVQKHVAVLERAGLVTKQRKGREHLVAGNPTRCGPRTRPSTGSNCSGATASPGWTTCSPPTPARPPDGRIPTCQ